MAATPHKKRSTLTYADSAYCCCGTHCRIPDAFPQGVIRALSEYQSAHKKHSVHLATIRAQGVYPLTRDVMSSRLTRATQCVETPTPTRNSSADSGHTGSPALSTSWFVKQVRGSQRPDPTASQVARGMVESPQLNHYALTSQTKKT